ncbi:MAG: hypothetical protein KME40_20625 [Komarekiella atlantica HA4396-MV6]|nr:hypothetical protein [Komarekiella atlantica HA4396-MV6]
MVLGSAIAIASRNQLSFASCSGVMLKFCRLVSTVSGLDYIGVVMLPHNYELAW